MESNQREPRCPECDGTNILDVESKYVCEDCGNEWVKEINQSQREPGYYRKRPVTIQAIQFTLDNHHEVMCFIKGNSRLEKGSIFIPTLEGEMRADKGDWIIKGVHGEFYPCKPDIFEKTYEVVSSIDPTPSQDKPEIKLPEIREVEERLKIDNRGKYIRNLEWNACIDKFKELNPHLFKD